MNINKLIIILSFQLNAFLVFKLITNMVIDLNQFTILIVNNSMVLGSAIQFVLLIEGICLGICIDYLFKRQKRW